MSKNYPSIPEPTDDPHSLRETVMALKQAMELLIGSTSNKGISVPSYQDLVDRGVLTKSQIPK